MIDFTSDTICPCLLTSKGSKFRASSKGAEGYVAIYNSTVRSAICPVGEMS